MGEGLGVREGEVSNLKQKTLTRISRIAADSNALKALRKLVPRLRDWLVAPKSDEGGCEPALGNRPANVSLSAFASEANGEQRQRLWRVRCVRNFSSPPQGSDADSKQNQFCHRPQRRDKRPRSSQGRAGAGFGKMVLTLALTFYPLPRGEEITIAQSRFCERLPGQSSRAFFKETANDSPSPPTGVGGEGRGEVARETNYLVAGRKDRGKRPTQGRAGAGLASPAGTGAITAAIVMTQLFRSGPFRSVLPF